MKKLIYYADQGDCYPTRGRPGNEVDWWSFAYAASFPGKYTINQPHFQANIISNQCYSAHILQIWSTPVGYEELARGFDPVRNGKIIWMNNNEYYCSGSFPKRFLLNFKNSSDLICPSKCSTFAWAFYFSLFLRELFWILKCTIAIFKLFSLSSGNIVAICMSHPDASEDVLRSWISHLQSENPELANISVIFNLSPTPRWLLRSCLASSLKIFSSVWDKAWFSYSRPLNCLWHSYWCSEIINTRPTQQFFKCEVAKLKSIGRQGVGDPRSYQCLFRLIGCSFYKNAMINIFPLTKNKLILSPKRWMQWVCLFLRNSLKFLLLFFLPSNPSMLIPCLSVYINAVADLGGGCRGCVPPHPPPPRRWDDFLIQLVFCKIWRFLCILNSSHYVIT